MQASEIAVNGSAPLTFTPLSSWGIRISEGGTIAVTLYSEDDLVKVHDLGIRQGISDRRRPRKKTRAAGDGAEVICLAEWIRNRIGGPCVVRLGQPCIKLGECTPLERTPL